MRIRFRNHVLLELSCDLMTSTVTRSDSQLIGIGDQIACTDWDILTSITLHNLYPGFYSYTEGATWKILDLLPETILN